MMKKAITNHRVTESDIYVVTDLLFLLHDGEELGLSRDEYVSKRKARTMTT